MSRAYRASRLASSSPKDFDFQYFVFQEESDYPAWWSINRIVHWFYSLPDDTPWNVVVCIMALLAVTLAASGLRHHYVEMLDVVYSLIYAVHVFGVLYYEYHTRKSPMTWSKKFGFLVDVISYLYYPFRFLPKENYRIIRLTCYYLRLHRPFRYLWALNDYNLKGSVLGTTLKYCYIFLLLRVTCALVWIQVDEVEEKYELTSSAERPISSERLGAELMGLDQSKESKFIRAAYIINKMFIPIGPSVAPANDYERVACLLVMMTGCLVVTGACIASLSLVISLYIRPEEAYRARFRLIMNEMKDSRVPTELRNKVETFYRMYWHKQRGVSVTQLLPIFPPTLPATIYTDIYFEGQQKSRILRDLSYQFLWELAKTMETIHYIPGDAIIHRSSQKSSIIYISYGDVEMVTAEDDITPILRMTRGTILSSCGGCAGAACGKAHVQIRAATFCTAHVLRAADLWRVAVRHGKHNGQGFIISSSFAEHFERVKRHYKGKAPKSVKYKSSILDFKRNLIALKEAKDANDNLLLDRTDIFLEIAGCYIMRNRADAALTDESDAICLRPTFPCILQPASSLIVAWQSFMALIVFVVAILHPYHLVYLKDVPLEFRFFDYVMTSVFTLDLVVHLSTGANVEEGVPINFAQTSSQQMRSHWFVLDVLSTLPVFEFIGSGHFAGLNKLLRLPKLFRVLKSMEEVCVYHSNALRFVSYSLVLLITCYLVAALQQGFMCHQFNMCTVTNFTHAPYWDSRVQEADAVEDRLMFGLYWAISMISFTSHRNQSWNVDSWQNLLYTTVVLEMCIILHIFIESVYSATIMVTSAMREDYESCIGKVKNFLIRNNVDPLLRHRFITYLQLCWYTDKAYSMTHKKTSIFFDLPPHVYQDIVARQRIKYVLCIPFMKYLHKEDLKLVASRARLFYTSPNEILLNTGDVSNEIYIIKRGICEVLDPDTKNVVATISVKNHFGVLECLLRFPTFYTVRAVTHVQVFSISRKYLLKAIQVPQIKNAIDFAKEQPEFTLLQQRREAFSAYEPPPPTPDRECFRLPRKHEPDSAFLHPFIRLGFLSILRYIFPRFTIRPDGRYMRRYEWFRAACALTAAMVFPSYTYLTLQWPCLYIVAYLLDTFAFLDIVQRLVVGYFNEEGILVYHPASTAAHYLKGAFIVDLLGWLPLENLEAQGKETFGNYTHITSTTQFLMLNRLLQLYRVPRTMDNLDTYIERADIILVIKAIPLFMALINVLTCLMVFESVDIYAGSGGEGGWLIRPHDDKGGSWLVLFNNAFRFNMTETPWNLHLASYFWIVYETTTTGYNIFMPSNLELMQVLFWGMVIGAMILTYFSVRIISVRANVNKALAGFQEHMKDIAAYMHKEKLDQRLQKEVLAYYEYNWDNMGGTDYRNVLKLCDQITLRTDAILHIYGNTFNKCPILYHCDVSLLRIVGRAVRSVYFLHRTRIIETDDVIGDMYFVDYGTVDIRTPDGETITELPRGSVFGNLEAVPTVRSPVAVVAGSNLHLLQINAQTFHKIIMDFPSVKVLLKKYRPHKENFIIGSFGESTSQMRSWKERTVSTPLITAGRRGLVKYLSAHHSLVTIYLILISMLCVYGDVYNAGFQYNRTWFIVGLYALDASFCLKVLVRSTLPHLVKHGEARTVLVSDRTSYFRSEFKYDILSCLPIELLCLTNPSDKWMMFSLLRLNRMFRIATVYNCLKRHHERLSINLVVSTVASVSIWFTLFVHACACAWYRIGVMEDRRAANSSWLHNDKGEPACDNLYVCAVYFVLTTFTQNGVGDIMPKKQSEVIFVMMLEIMSTMVCMVYVGEFSNIIQYQSFRSFGFYCKYLELQEFLKNNRVAKNLVAVVSKYSLHLWRESRGLQEPHFLRKAPHCLKLRVMSGAYKHHLTQHPVFKDCEPAFLRQLVGCFQLYTYNEDMYVVKEGEITDAMYLIHKGQVQELDEDMEEIILTYNAGECFGLVQGLTRGMTYTYSYRTIIKSLVLTLKLDDWEYLLEHFPISKALIYKNEHSDSGRPDDDKGKEEKKRVHIVREPTKIPSQASGLGSSRDDGEGPPPPPAPPSSPESDVSPTSGLSPLSDASPQSAPSQFSPTPPLLTSSNPPSPLPPESLKETSIEDLMSAKSSFRLSQSDEPTITQQPGLWPMGRTILREDNKAFTALSVEPSTSNKKDVLEERNASKESVLQLTRELRRKPTVSNVDRESVALELAKLVSPYGSIKQSDETEAPQTIEFKRMESNNSIGSATSLLTRWPTYKRRSTMSNVDKESVAHELDVIESEMSEQTLRSKVDKEKVATGKKESVSKPENTAIKIDNKFLMNRHMSITSNIEIESAAIELDTIQSVSVETLVPKTVHITERKVSRESEDSDNFDNKWPMHSRRSTIANVDKELVALELERMNNLQDSPTPNYERASNVSDKITARDEIAQQATEDKLQYLVEEIPTVDRPTDVDEAYLKSKTFMQKVVDSAKKLMKQKSNDQMSVQDMLLLGQEDKDSLLLQQDEVTTKSLIEKVALEKERRSLQSIQSLISVPHHAEIEPLVKTDQLLPSKDEDRLIKKPKHTVEIKESVSIESLQLERSDSQKSVEGYILEKHAMDETTSQRSGMHRHDVVREQGATSSRGLRRQRVRYQDVESKLQESRTSVLSRGSQSPYQLRKLSDDPRPVRELTPAERNLRMMDSDLEPGPAAGEAATARNETLEVVDSETDLLAKPK